MLTVDFQYDITIIQNIEDELDEKVLVNADSESEYQVMLYLSAKSRSN